MAISNSTDRPPVGAAPFLLFRPAGAWSAAAAHRPTEIRRLRRQGGAA